MIEKFCPVRRECSSLLAKGANTFLISTKVFVPNHLTGLIIIILTLVRKYFQAILPIAWFS